MTKDHPSNRPTFSKAPLQKRAPYSLNGIKSQS